MIGLFVTALVGVYTIEDLWEKFGDTKMPVVRTLITVVAVGADKLILYRSETN